MLGKVMCKTMPTGPSHGVVTSLLAPLITVHNCRVIVSECGVYRGTGIKTVIDCFGNKGFTKTFWGYDTFDYNPVEGHSFPGQEDGLFDEIHNRFEAI